MTIFFLFFEFFDNEKCRWNQSVYNSNRKDYGEVVVYGVECVANGGVNQVEQNNQRVQNGKRDFFVYNAFVQAD